MENTNQLRARFIFTNILPYFPFMPEKIILDFFHEHLYTFDKTYNLTGVVLIDSYKTVIRR